MLTCKDCIHFDACIIMEYSSYDPAYYQEFGCDGFKNKADVVEVVRCKDCVYSNENGTTCHYSVGRDTKPNGFCSDDERGEENG